MASLAHAGEAALNANSAATVCEKLQQENGGNNKNWESVSVNNGTEAVDVTQYTDISKDFSKAMDFNEESNLSRKPNLIVSFGEMLIDFVPSVSGVSLAEAIMFKKAAGGAPANVAVAIAKLGGFSAFIGKLNEDKVAFITNGQDCENDEVVMSLWHPELKLLLITEGQKGCRYYTKAFRERVGSIPVKTVDTTGAGDAYTGALKTCHCFRTNRD